MKTKHLDLSTIIKYIPTPRHIISYSRASLAQYGASYTLFSLFFCFSSIVPYFMWEHKLIEQYNIMLYLHLVGALGCGLLLVRANWPQSLWPYLRNFYHLLLLYTLPSMSTVMFLLTQGSVGWLINIAINIIFLIALVDWMTFLFLTDFGVGLGFLFYTLALGPINIKLDFSTCYLVVYQSILASLIGLLFLRRRQQNFDQLATTKQQLSNAHQATPDSLVEALQYRNKVYQNLGK